MSDLTAIQQLKRWIVKTSILAALLVLTACAGIMENDLTMSWDERWTANVQITISGDQVQFVGGKEALDRQIQQNLQRQQSVANTLGIRLSQSQREGSDGSVTYIFDTQGQGFDNLNRFIFDGAAQIQKTTTADESRLVFRYSPLLTGAAFYSLRLNIRGGKIIATNADQISGNTFAWANLMQTGAAQLEMVQPVAHPVVEHRLTVFQDERWKVETRLIVNGEEYAAIGDDAVVRQQIRPIQQPILAQANTLGLSLQESNERGSDGSAIYIVSTRGQGLNVLNRYIFQGAAKIEAVTESDTPYVHFEYALAGKNVREYNLQLKGGEVIEANTGEVKNGTAIWRDLAEGSTAEADVTFATVVPRLADHITLLGGERWEAETKWIVSAEDYAVMGDEAEIDRLLQSLQQPMLDRTQTSGVSIEQRKDRDADGSIIYVIATKGTGLDLLNQTIFAGGAQVQKVTGSNQPYVQFKYSPADRAKAGYSLELEGAEIIKSNADEMREDLVVWRDLFETDTAEANITEPRRVVWRVIVLTLLGLVVIAVGGYVFLRQQRETGGAN